MPCLYTGRARRWGGQSVSTAGERSQGSVAPGRCWYLRDAQLLVLGLMRVERRKAPSRSRVCTDSPGEAAPQAPHRAEAHQELKSHGVLTPSLRSSLLVHCVMPQT